MQETIPLLRSAARVVSQPTSKIPHLRFHIAHRQSRAQRLQYNEYRDRFQQTRKSSNVASQTYLDRTVENTENNDEGLRRGVFRKIVTQDVADDGVSVKVFSEAEELNITNMFDILEEGSRDRVLSGLMSHSIGIPFIQQADGQIFNKALLALDPDYFIEPFKDAECHWKGKRFENTLQVKTLDYKLSTFAVYLDHIVATRRQSGMRLDLEACNHLLKCAGSMGDASLARSVFDVIMPEDSVEPDLETYNYYCRALVWSHAFSSAENLKLRVLPRILGIRASRNPPEELSGHKTATRMLGVKGLREETLGIFKDCIDRGYAANELTFINLMIAMGREADLEGAKSILKSVWNIDVGLLEAYDEEEVESPTFYEIGHPLRPSQQLLFGIAHIFGSNNDIRTAWHLVDFVSRNYDLPISEEVWQHLCEWAFVLSLRRTPAESKQNRNLGQIPHESFIQMVGSMSDEPHNISPSASIHWLLCRSWRDQKHLDNTIHHIEQLQQIVDKQQSEIKVLVNEVLSYAEAAITSPRPNKFANKEFYDLRRRYSIAFFQLQRNMQFLNVAVNRHLLSCKGWPGSGKLTEWERRRLPSLVEQFARYLPAQLTYETKTGTVELQTKTTRHIESYKQHRLDMRILPRVLNAMDTDDQARLNRRMTALPQIIIRAKKYCMRCESIGHNMHECRTHHPFSSDWIVSTELGHEEHHDSESDDVFVLNPSIPRRSVPFAFEPGSEKEFARPDVPFM